MSPRRGEFWWAKTPGQPCDLHQPRPCLVISDDERNQIADDYLVIPAFSRGPQGPTHVTIAAGDEGLAHDSVVFCEEITCIHESFLKSGPMGKPVDEEILADIVGAIRRAIGEDEEW